MIRPVYRRWIAAWAGGAAIGVANGVVHEATYGIGPMHGVSGAGRRRLSHQAQALRGGHAAIALFELGCLGYVWACGLTGHRDRRLRVAIGVLAAEGVGLVIGRGNCPFGPLQERVGDPVPLFELVLPPVWARRAVPILTAVAGAGILLAVRPARR